jgi:nanoRNase/pAp phosphatase (c-di-AMP/oligoRNAs hydrolase)
VSADQIFAIVMASIVTSAWVAARVLRGPLGQALAFRLGGGGHEVAGPTEVAELRSRLGELEERLDFTERVLLQEREAGRLGQGDTR